MDEESKSSAATVIQSLARGVQSRIKFKKDLPTLKANRKKRNFCIECELNVAVKKCRDCKDRFCDSCFISIHRKGARKTHSWESIVANHFDNTQGTSRKGNNS